MKHMIDLFDSFKPGKRFRPGNFSLMVCLLVLGMFGFSSYGYAQDGWVTGTVTTKQGETLIGVSVLEKGTLNGVTTDVNGKYSIRVSGNAVLQFSFVGMKKQEVGVNNRSLVNVVMEEETENLEEVVVIGYGVVRKRDLTGAVSSVSAESVKGLPVKSVDQMIQGRASGVFMVQNSGMPGAGATVRIRGGNSISGGNEPLYVIDGVPVYAQAGSSQTTLSPLNTIATSDIESIEVLKDASSTAIYGARGANGVILITTKKGKAGRTSVSFDMYAGFQNIRKKYKLLNAAEFEQLANEASVNGGGQAIYDPNVIPETTDWQKLVRNDNALTQNYQLSISGGDEKTKFLTSFNYQTQDGIIKATELERMTFRGNLERIVCHGLKFGTNLSLAHVTTNKAGVSALEMMLVAPPNIPVKDAEGKYTKQNRLGEIFTNPMAVVNDKVDKNKQLRVLGNAFGEWEIIKGLTFKSTIGLDLIHSDNRSYTPMTINAGEIVNGDGNASNDKTYTWVNENTLTYIRDFGPHAVNALVGFTQQGSRWEMMKAGAQGFLNDNLQMNDLGSGTVAKTPSTGVSEWSLMSYLARINYSYNGKYMLTASFRADGSSRFGANNRWGYFPSAAVAWRASEEGFIKDLNVFSNLKIRLSHGWIGNQDGIGTYPSIALLDKMAAVFGDTKYMGYGPSQVANPDLKWETTRQTDLGIDFGFFNNRLNLTADFYYKKTTDLLLNVKIPATSGFDSALKNVGSVENKGLELSLSGDPFVGDFSWNSSFNITFNRNKVLSLGGEESIVPAGGNKSQGMDVSRLLKVGEPIGIFYGFVGDGTFSTTDDIKNSAQPKAKPGDIRFKDFSGSDGKPDNKIDDYDRKIIGCAQPDFYGGFTNTFSYKNFDLNVFIVFSYGNDIYNANKARLEDMQGTWNQSRNVLNRWTPEHQNTPVPRALTAKATSRSWDYLIEDGSYLRIQNIQLGYTIPEKILKKTRLIRSARVYASLQNFFTFTNYSGYDPEVSLYGQDNVGMGYDYGSYPSVKTVLFGLNLNF